MQRLATAAALCAAMAGLPGCGAARAVDGIPGPKVATMAEHQLEAMHPDLATGTMTCPRLHFAMAASVRCERVAELSGGRQIRVPGTVTVTSTRDGGRLHVRLDNEVAEFGISSEHLEADLRARVQRFLGAAPSSVSCPYLSGPRGTRVTCTATVLGLPLATGMTVTGVDQKDYRVRYRFDHPLFTVRDNPGLPSLLRMIRRGGVAP